MCPLAKQASIGDIFTIPHFQVVASDSNLDKIVADFIKVEDQNFALFNYVTEMNNQVEGLQESIAKLRSDIKEAKVRP